VNWLQLTQAVKRESGLGSAASIAGLSTATGDDLRMFHWVQWAARDITLQREDWRWRRGSVSVATTNAVNSPASLGITDFAGWKPSNNQYKPSAYRVSDGAAMEQELSYLEYDQFRKQFMLGAPVPGSVQYWSISPAEELLLGPAPDSAHNIRADYAKDYSELTADDSVPSLPTRFHMLIVWRALMEYGGFDAAGEVYQRAQANYQSAWTQLSQSQLETPGFIARSLA
jgi:hypothetical protein